MTADHAQAHAAPLATALGGAFLLMTPPSVDSASKLLGMLAVSVGLVISINQFLINRRADLDRREDRLERRGREAVERRVGSRIYLPPGVERRSEPPRRNTEGPP